MKKPQAEGVTGRLLARWLHSSPRRATEFLIIVGVLLTARPTGDSMVLGVVLSTLGQLFRLWAAGYGYKEGQLAIQGPYRFVRHPYFLGTALLFLGLALAGREAIVMALTLLAMTLIYRPQYRRDEARLAQHLGPRFTRYRDEVPAFVPRLWPVQAVGDKKHKFSISYAFLVGRHRELDAAVGLLVAFGLLYLCQVLTAKDLFHGGVLVAVVLYLVGRFIYYGVAKRAGRPKPIGI